MANYYITVEIQDIKTSIEVGRIGIKIKCRLPWKAQDGAITEAQNYAIEELAFLQAREKYGISSEQWEAIIADHRDYIKSRFLYKIKDMKTIE